MKTTRLGTIGRICHPAPDHGERCRLVRGEPNAKRRPREGAGTHLTSNAPGP